MRYASIDIGTNTLRLLVAEPSGDGSIRPLLYRRAITRLGGGYTDNIGIDAVSAERTFAALREFKKVMDEYRVDRKIAVGTSVVRRARNREWFLKEVFKRTGFGASVISGDEEARLTLIGVFSAVGTDKDRLIVDIGGGSTEFIATRREKIAGLWSMEMGVVHLAEDYLKSDPPDVRELAMMDREIRGVMEKLKESMKKDGVSIGEYSEKAGSEIVGTAGTITTLAAIDQGLTVYDRERIDNYIIGVGRIRAIYDNLVRLTLPERGKMPALEKGREDLIIPGTLIVLDAMEEFGFTSMRVSDAGLLEGAIINELRRHEEEVRV